MKGWSLSFNIYDAVPDPDLEIREGGQSSRPLDKGGVVSKKIIFGKGGPLPWSRHCDVIRQSRKAAFTLLCCVKDYKQGLFNRIPFLESFLAASKHFQL